MPRVIVENNDRWMINKIQTWIDIEAAILKKAIGNCHNKIKSFENRYGNVDRNTLYGQAADMDILEWEGEIGTISRLREKLKSLDQIVFENK